MGGDLYKHPPGSGQDLQDMARDGSGTRGASQIHRFYPHDRT